jgi:hypothetical protein
MPKAGVEPARGKAPLDFESSASSSSATSAEGIERNGIRTELLDVPRGVIMAPHKERSGPA